MAAASDYAAVVQQLYVSYFGRPADFYGLTSFENALLGAGAPTTFADLSATLQAGTNAGLNALVNGFSASAESTALYGTGTDTISVSKFVNAIYNNVLGRDADLTGLNFWVNAIQTGALTQADAAVAITEGALSNTSDQGKIDAAVVTNKVAVATEFTTELGASTAQINGYSGDAAAAAARAMLSTVTDTTDVKGFDATIATTIGSIVGGNGATTALTIGEDDITGTTANDIYTASTVTSGGAVHDTLTSLDVINGGGGTNTLKATLAYAEAPTLSNVQNVELRFVGGSLDLANATGVTSVAVANSTANGEIFDVGNVASLAVSNQTSSVFFADDSAKTVSVAFTNFGNNTSNSFIDLASDAATTVNVTTNNSQETIFADTQIKTLGVDVEGAVYSYLNVNDSTAITTATISGNGYLYLNTEMTHITKFDASGNSIGVRAILGSQGATLSVTGGSGGDAIRLDGAVTKASVNLGAGDDLLTLTGTIAAAGVFDGGTGTNTLLINSATNLNAYTVTPGTAAAEAAAFKAAFLDFQVLEISNNPGVAATLAVDTAIYAGFSSYKIDASTSAIALTDLGATTALTVDGNVAGLTLGSSTPTVADTAAVSLTLNNGATIATTGVALAGLTTDAATLAIHSNGLLSTGSVNTVTLNAADTGLDTVTIDGSQALTLNTTALTQAVTINASAATGVVTVDAHLATGLVNINGGSAADHITGGTAGGAIYGGAGGDAIVLTGGGIDTIVYKAVGESTYSVKADGLTLGAGIDTITNFVSGTDKIDVTGLGLSSTSVIVNKTVADGTLASLTALAATSDFYSDSTGTVRSVVEVTVGSETFLFVDANKDHKFDASTDLVIHLTGTTQTVAAGDIIFA